MRILYLCKRHYMGHDVIADRYARLYEQPFQLAQLNNEVLGICLSYRPCQPKDEVHAGNFGKMRWIGLNAGSSRAAIFYYPTHLLALAREFKPDLIVSSSDCIHVILGSWIASKIGVKFSADLYDDYESFGLAKIPLVKFLFRKALNKAKIISCVSKSLAKKMELERGNGRLIAALPSTINKDLFYPREKQKMRLDFNLSTDIKVVGTAGGLTKEKGIDCVYQAFLSVANERPDIHFLLAGPIDKNCPPPKHDRIHYLGKLPHNRIGDFFGALDVGVVYLRNTNYGNLSFPQKAYEMAACKIPMVVAAVGDMKYLFFRERHETYTADNNLELKQAIINQLNTPSIPDLAIDDWVVHAQKLNELYLKALKI